MPSSMWRLKIKTNRKYKTRLTVVLTYFLQRWFSFVIFGSMICFLFKLKMWSLFCPQVLSWYGEGVCFQLLLLAGALSHFHHWHDTHQHLLSRLPGGLFLLHAVWRQCADAASQIHPAAMGLAHWVHLLCDRHEEPGVCKRPYHKEVQKLYNCTE